MFRNSKNLFQKLIYSSETDPFRTGFLNYETPYFKTIIFRIGDAGAFSSLYYYFKDNLDNFKNFESV